MPVEFKNYYDILGVSSNASDAEIKKAFRSLARKHHPDIAKDKTASEIKFKEINEANEVLSDPDKRRKYDALGADWNRPERQSSGFRRGAENGSEFHFEGTGFSDFFEQFFGSRVHPPGGSFAQRGQDIESDILVTLAEALHGSMRTINLQRVDSRSGQVSLQTLRVKIPPGVREAQLIRLCGKGQEGSGGGNAGDLYLRVQFAKHPDFRVQGANLYFDLELSPWEAVLGATVHITTLDGTVALKVPPGTTADREFRLRGKGLPTGNGMRGDLHAIAKIQVPAVLNSKEKALWEQLAGLSTFKPRSAPCVNEMIQTAPRICHWSCFSRNRTSCTASMQLPVSLVYPVVQF
ncbi:DnaJ C-terminal domain-containing protein [Geobacter sp. SVR]|uniref:DnaJ C-terminal domain-containing protein n=1 Tax=Geobacter sp. SVR TaxID=2495594 RepID=UPI00143EFAA7|nr:J domain-containing protein [Geobacter sp. SVR]BCS51891.1 molecular chaperone DnaJ [Geobacter sp. SVR]GCF87725.1 curved DNA-binding protein [Geobacter sp. SVR]